MSDHVSGVRMHGVQRLCSDVPMLQCWLVRRATRARHWRPCICMCVLACSSAPRGRVSGLVALSATSSLYTRH